MQNFTKAFNNPFFVFFFSGNPKQKAVDTLNNLWGDKLNDNELGPLITRVTDEVLQLNG